MLTFFKKLFGKTDKSQSVKEFTEQEYESHYKLKSEGLENLLGKMHDMVGHAIIPFAMGGAVDMYYFPNHINGTGFATMELLEPDGSGPLPNRHGTYELVAFTRKTILSENDTETSFDQTERNICGIFTTIGLYSSHAALNPLDTLEIPEEEKENTYLALGLYEPEGKKFKIGMAEHHLLLCIQIFKAELEFARENGTEVLFDKLKQAGYYPYSDMDRPPVI